MKRNQSNSLQEVNILIGREEDRISLFEQADLFEWYREYHTLLSSELFGCVWSRKPRGGKCQHTAEYIISNHMITKEMKQPSRTKRLKGSWVGDEPLLWETYELGTINQYGPLGGCYCIKACTVSKFTHRQLFPNELYFETNLLFLTGFSLLTGLATKKERKLKSQMSKCAFKIQVLNNLFQNWLFQNDLKVTQKINKIFSSTHILNAGIFFFFKHGIRYWN